MLLTISPRHPLLPDEDWVVKATENPLSADFNFTTETYKIQRYQNFFVDLFAEYLGDGHSLSDEYARRYADLNQAHCITWRDSLRYTGSVRQEQPLAPDQILASQVVEPIKRAKPAAIYVRTPKPMAPG